MAIETIYNEKTTETGLSDRQLATDLTLRIKANGETAMSALLEMGSDLKKMRDEKLYIYVGYNSFEDYIEEEIKISRRSAYNFISAVENLPAGFINRNAQIGITKMVLLAKLTDVQREEVMQEKDVANITTRQLEEVIKQKQDVENQLQQQLSLFEQQKTDMDTLQQQILHLQSLHDTIKSDAENEVQAKISAVRKKANRETEKLRQKLKEEVEERVAVEKQIIQKQAQTEREKIAKEEQEKAEKAISELKAETEALKIQAQNAQKISKVDADLITADYMLKEIQEMANKITGQLRLMRSRNHEKTDAVKTAASEIMKSLIQKLEQE